MYSNMNLLNIYIMHSKEVPNTNYYLALTLIIDLWGHMLSEMNTLVKSLTPITSKHQRVVSLKRAFIIAY